VDHKIFSFTSDGASVMQGNISGVATRITKVNPYIYSTHCIAHRLSLACESAEKQVEFCIYAKSMLKKIHVFFSNSSKRIQILSTYQETLNNPQLKILKIFDVRWLSLYEAVNNICFSIEPLLDTLLHTISESKNQKTQYSIFDLYSDLCNWQTLAFFYFLQDILAELAILSKFFQTRFLYFYDIYPIIQNTITKLEKAYLDLDNNCFELSTNLNKFFISTPPKTNTKIGSHTLTWTLNQENDLMVDI
ncbi:24645_t:CDS:1, partial [Racocetra persica]